MSDKKTYVLDTNVLLSDPNSISSFAEHDVIIPMVVLEELDRHKTRSDDVGRNARQVNRILDSMRSQGKFAEGIKLPSGGRLMIRSIDASVTPVSMPSELLDSKADNQIIAFMLQLATKLGYNVAVLVSKDINVRVKCDCLGISCEDYLRMRVADTPQGLYRGVDVVEAGIDAVNELYNRGSMPVSDVAWGDHHQPFPNQIVVLKHVSDGSTSRSALTRYVKKRDSLVLLDDRDCAYGLRPRNKEQSFALDLLLDDDVKLVTLVGASGTGKTLLALAAGLEQLNPIGSRKKYEKLVVTRPVQPVGRDIGFLPGTLQEKMEPWIAPVKDNINFLTERRKPRGRRPGRDHAQDDVYLSLMQEQGLIEIEAITFIRGRSIPNAYIIIDEAQNLSMHELKTIITRVGDNTKIILTGDIEQIDNVHVDIYTNGLTAAVEKFKGYEIAGHVTLLKGERSPLASLASQIL